MISFPSSILTFSPHAEKRMAQRGISVTDVEYVFYFGLCIWRNGAQYRFLRYIDIPEKDRKHKHHLNGTVVLLDTNGCQVLTVYRNPTALRDIKRKSKWGRCRSVS